MTEYGRIHTDGSRSGGQPLQSDVERVARALAQADGIEICSDATYALSSYGHKAQAALSALRQPTQSDDEAYELGERDGYESAVQDIDMLTGGDGEYCYSTIGGERHCPDADSMKARIARRFTTQSDALQAEIETLRHDLERQMTIANEHVNEAERLREALAHIAFSGADGPYGEFGEALNEHQMRRVAKAALQEQSK